MLAKYIDAKSGWRMFFFSLALACVFGLSFRLYFNPDRIKKWIDEGLVEQGADLSLSFKSARLQLARGSIPIFAIEMSGVEGFPAHECSDEAAVKIARLRVPLRFSSLLSGQLAIGLVSAEDLSVDLDGLKATCGSKPAGQNQPKEAINVVHIPRQPTAVLGQAQPWWKNDQLASIEARVGGFRFSRVELLFENKTKKVYLESFLAEPADEAGAIHIESELVVPPELIFSERIPSLHIEATGRATSADVKLTAALSEGNLKAQAKLTPAPGGRLDIDVQMGAQNVPLSMLVPLLTKSEIIKGAFRPRFLWMNCQAKISGRFQGLLNENPLNLQNCEIVGNGARVEVKSATRKADGIWEPFYVDIANLKLAQVMDTFEWKGLDGVFSDYGLLNGKIEVSARNDGRFIGSIDGAQLRFSHHDVQAQQKLDKIITELSIRGTELKGEISKIDFNGGTFDGDLKVEFERHSSEGHFKAVIRSLKLHPEIEQLIFGGLVEKIQGQAEARTSEGKLKSFKSFLALSGLSGQDLRLKEASIQAELEKDSAGESRPVINFRSGEVELRSGAWLLRAMKPLFFAHQFSSEWVPVHSVAIRGYVPTEGGFVWESAQGALESGKIRVSSLGDLNRERNLNGSVSVDFPALKKIKWHLAGTMDEPLLSEDAKSFSALKEPSQIDDRALGLNPHNSGPHIRQ